MDFLVRLKEGGTILFDGAMGTMLYQKGIFLDRCFEEACLSDPSIVLDIHKEYLDAGAEALTTNSWGANIHKLKGSGNAEKFEAINEKAVALARQAIEETGRTGGVFVAGSIGPLGPKVAPLGTLSVSEVESLFFRQASILSKAGADLIILETFVDLHELAAAVKGVRKACGLPLIASLTINNEGTSLYGTEPEMFTVEIDRLSPDVIGLNCSEGPKVMLETAERILRVTQRPLCIQPNAGIPINVEGRNIYQTTPKYMAIYARRMLEAGVRIVGGCCGTTPDHIREMRSEIRVLSPRVSYSRIKVVIPESAAAPAPLEKKSAWGAKLARGERVTCVELVPPKGLDVAKLVSDARALKEKGIDAINVPDSPRAQAKMSAHAASVVIQREAGIEAIPHYACKDKNLLALQADLLGSHALGIRNILVVTGDPPNMGTYPDATAVFNIDSIGLCNLVRMLNHGFDMGNNSVGAPTEFCYGVGLNPSAVNLERELARIRLKIEAGAEFAITQPVFDAEPLLKFMERMKGLRRIPIIAGIWPLLSLRNAEFMKNEVPGVFVPDSIIERMAKCDTKESAVEEGISIAKELYEALKGAVSGVQTRAPLGKMQYALAVLGK
jgi:methionine synthase I (cobalamin-dependent)/5,10-methylenetetrahydrofolate reductase